MFLDVLYAPDQCPELLMILLDVRPKLPFHATDGGDGVLEGIFP